MTGKRFGNRNREETLPPEGFVPSHKQFFTEHDRFGQSLYYAFTGGRHIVQREVHGQKKISDVKKRLNSLDLLKHLLGEERHGLSPTLASGKAEWGALDLDSHDYPTTPERQPEALRLVGELAAQGVTAYWKPSRGGHGAHVFVLFGATVDREALRAWLEGIAQPLRAVGLVEVFPSVGEGENEKGMSIFLPYFGGIADALLDADARPVSPDKLEVNPPGVVPPFPQEPEIVKGPEPTKAAEPIRPVWPPPYWNRSKKEERRGSGWTPRTANEGKRRPAARWAAVWFLQRGRPFKKFEDWNMTLPKPLEPKTLSRLWEWAQKKVR